jgi:serine/threonine protein kinase
MTPDFLYSMSQIINRLGHMNNSIDKDETREIDSSEIFGSDLFKGKHSKDPLNDLLLKDAPELEGYKILGPCVLYEKLGWGGMSVVYRGWHLNLDMDVAVKCLLPNLVERNREFIVRFQREARIAAQINHPNVVRVYNVSQSSGIYYLVMEFVEGENARQRVLRKGPLQIQEASQIVIGAAQGLTDAHRRGMVHRDIKPDNIMISIDGEVKVADLGLAKATTGEAIVTTDRLHMGTWSYMPPEQWEDMKKAGPPADVWALGAIFFFLLQGQDAIRGNSPPEILRQISNESFPDIRKSLPHLQAEMASIINRATQKNPTDRYPTSYEFLSDLKRLQPGIGVDLSDPELMSIRKSNSMVSPPQKNTITKIKTTLSEPPKPVSTPSKSELDSGSSSKKPSFIAVIIIAVLLGSIFFFIRDENSITGLKDTFKSENIVKTHVPKPDTTMPTKDADMKIQPEEAGEDLKIITAPEKPIEDQKITTEDKKPIEDSRTTAEREIVKEESTRIEIAKQKAQRESAACREAIKTNSIAVAEDFIQTYPNSDCIDEVTVNLKKLRIIKSFEDIMVHVEGGTFQMGDETGDLGNDCRPVHRVSLNPFFISRYEVTQKQWRNIMGSNPSHFSGCDECPVESVSWADVQEFIKKLNKLADGKYRLPTEAEWEYAARGGSRSRDYIFSGSNSSDQVAWTFTNSGSRTQPVGQKTGNELALYDMSGNVFERCSDWYDENFYYFSPQKNPLGPSSGSAHVMRGGYWDNNVRITERWKAEPHACFDSIGFRLAKSD